MVGSAPGGGRGGPLASLGALLGAACAGNRSSARDRSSAEARLRRRRHSNNAIEKIDKTITAAPTLMPAIAPVERLVEPVAGAETGEDAVELAPELELEMELELEIELELGLVLEAELELGLVLEAELELGLVLAAELVLLELEVEVALLLISPTDAIDQCWPEWSASSIKG
jgi:hypothetical protein